MGWIAHGELAPVSIVGEALRGAPPGCWQQRPTSCVMPCTGAGEIYGSVGTKSSSMNCNSFEMHSLFMLVRFS